MWRIEKIVDVNKNLNGLCLLNKIIITLIQKIVSHITWNLKFPRLPPFMDNVLRSPGTGDIFPGPHCPHPIPGSLSGPLCRTGAPHESRGAEARPGTPASRLLRECEWSGDQARASDMECPEWECKQITHHLMLYSVFSGHHYHVMTDPGSLSSVIFSPASQNFENKPDGLVLGWMLNGQLKLEKYFYCLSLRLKPPNIYDNFKKLNPTHPGRDIER